MTLTTAKINAQMVSALQGVNGVMEALDKSMDTASMRETMKEFAKQSEKMGMK